MQPQQLHDLIIKPTLQYMGGRYYSKDAAMLLLATAAIESDCGYYIKQINGPALGVWQMEHETHNDIWINCDAMSKGLVRIVDKLFVGDAIRISDQLTISPMYACAMARLKYSMDTASLPSHNDIDAIYRYYKRIYNTELGASTKAKFVAAWEKHNLSKVVI